MPFSIEMEYHPLDAEKNEIRVLYIIPDKEYAASVQEGKEPETLLGLKMKTVSLDDFTPKSHMQMEAKGTTIYKRSILFDDDFPELMTDGQWTNNDERANGLQNVNRVIGAAIEAEDFGRWNWGDCCTLSYVWGDTTGKRKILVNGHVMEVTRNLWEFLHHMMLDPDDEEKERVWLWIDAICINQQDVEEQNAQVKRMKNIYDQSLGCIAWLGPASDDSDKAMDMLKTLAEQQVNTTAEGIEYMSKVRSSIVDDKAETSFSVGTWKAFNDFLCRPYWSRLWIIQEIALSYDSLNIICGKKAISWPLFCSALNILSCDMEAMALAVQSDVERLDLEYEKAGKLLRRFFDQFNRLQQLMICSWAYESGTKLPHLSAILPISRTANETDARDKVYGILSLLDPKIVKLIEPNYKLTTEEVYINFAKASVMGTGSLDILCHSRFDGEESRQLPTWVPDWRDGEIVGQELTVSVPYQTSRDQKSDPSLEGDSLILQGFVFDKVDGLGAAEEMPDSPLFDVIQPKQRTNGSQSEAATRESLWRSFVANRDGQGELAPDSWAGLLDIPWNSGAESTFMLWGFTELQERNKSLMVCGREFQSYFHAANDSDIVHSADWVGIATTRVGNVFMGRRLITTEKGYIGVALNKSRQGDLIVIALGSSVPFVLRPKEHGDTYAFVGEAYIHGIMEGQAMEWLESGKCSVGEFAIS